MDFLQLAAEARTYRRFTGEPVPQAVIEEMLEAVRIASAAGNFQTLKYVLVQDKKIVSELARTVTWAAMLPKELGTPKPEEYPEFFVAIAHDPSVKDHPSVGVDVGIALSSLAYAAAAHGVGHCVFGTGDRNRIAALIQLPENLRYQCCVAFGYPAHKSTVVPVPADGSVKYYLDDERNYCVPKRGIEELVRRI